ncbi:MAG: leucine-rich repeat domain-containing protein [Anaerococcus sp.]
MSAVIVSQASVSNAQSENNSQVNYGQLIKVESTIEEIKTKTQISEEINLKETKSLSENKELNSTELTVDEIQIATQTPEGTNSKDLETLPEKTQAILAVSNLEEKQTDTETLSEESEALPENTDLTSKLLTTEETLPLDVEEQIAQVSVLEEVIEEEMKLELSNLEDDSVIGKTFGEVFDDQRIAKEILIKAGYKDNDITIDENANITNIITESIINEIEGSISYYTNDSIPVESLKGLEYFKNINAVNFSDTNFLEFPKELLELPNIAKISLSNKTYKGDKPINLPDGLKDLKLTDLNLNNVRITEIPTWITQITTLKNLNLVGSNVYTDNTEFLLPESIMVLSNLEKLELSNNSMKKLPNDLYLLSNLTTFRLVSNSLEELSDDNYNFINKLTTKYVPFQWVVKQGGEKNISQNIDIQMPQIVDFLLDKENSVTFSMYENGTQIQLDMEKVYNNGTFIFIKDQLEINKNYKIIAKTTGGLFNNSTFIYNFSGVNPEEIDEEETPDDTGTGNGEETPDDIGTGNGEETPDDTGTDNGEVNLEVQRLDEPVVIENKPEKVMAEKISLEKTVMPFGNDMLPKAGEKDSNLVSVAMLFIITSIGSLFALLRKK